MPEIGTVVHGMKYSNEPERHERIVRCIKQLVNMTREAGKPVNNGLLSLYSGGEFPGEGTGWIQEIADQHGLHRDQVDQLIRIVLNLDD